MAVIPPKELQDIQSNITPWYTNIRRADKTAGFASGMRRSLMDLNVKRDTYSDEIENDENQIYQLELELQVLREMQEKLGQRIERREISDREFQLTLRDARLASKKLKKATTSLAGITSANDGSGRMQMRKGLSLYQMPDSDTI